MTFSTFASPGVSLQGGGGSVGGGAASLPISGNGATVTASTPLVDGTQTWNNAAVTFTSFKLNITDTASNAASLLMDLGTGGGTFASKFSVDKAGNTAIPSNTLGRYGFTGNLSGMLNSSGTGNLFFRNNAGSLTGFFFDGFAVPAAHFFGWVPSNAITTPDLFLTRRAAANLRFGSVDAAAPVAQTLSVQSGTAGASATTVSISGTALTIAGTTTGTIAIGHAVTGTGVTAGTLITAGSGSSWTVNNSQTVGPITAYFNSVGQNLTITGSQGSGPSAGGSIIFQVAPAGSAATTAQNALATALTINSAQQALFSAGTASAPSLAFAARTTQGFYDGGGYIVVALGGQKSATFGTIQGATTGAVTVPSGGGFAFSSTNDADGAIDTYLRRDAVNTLAQRNGANAQAFNIYNTTDGTNAEWVKCYWTSNKFIINTQGSGTGNTSRVIELQCGGGAKLNINSGDVTVTGALLMAPDNTYDIGASNATRPRSVYAGTSITPGSGVTVAGLPTPSTGMIARVTDATAPVIGATVTGGGAAYALVNYNGANWTVIGV